MSNKLILSSILFFLGGCTSIPHMEGDARASHVSLKKVEMGVEESFAFVKGDWPGSDWWTTFGDQQLTALIIEGLKENPTLKKAQARIASAAEMARVRRSFFFPTLGVEAESNWMYFGKNSFFRSIDPTIPPYIDQIDVGPTLSYEFDFWGKNRHMFKSALGLKKMEEAEAASSTLIVTTSIAQAYFTIQKDLARKTLLQEIESLRLSFLNLTQQRRVKGIGSQMDNLKAKKRLEEIQEALAENEKLIETDHYVLDSLSGESPGVHAVFFTSLGEETDFALPENIAIDLVARRPDLAVQIWRAEAAAHDVGAAKADFYPNVDLNVFAGFESLHFGSLFSPNSYLYSIVPAIHLPIFNAGRIRSNLRSKMAKFEEAIFSYNETLLKAAQEVADRIAAVKWVSCQVKIQKETLSTLEAQVSLAEARLQHGLDTALEVIEMKEMLCLEQLKLIDLRELLILAKVSLIKALGGGYNG
jgi:NodT family efflux transporter outer membrane factor (OMF) lipoprotein